MMTQVWVEGLAAPAASVEAVAMDQERCAVEDSWSSPVEDSVRPLPSLEGRTAVEGGDNSSEAVAAVRKG